MYEEHSFPSCDGTVTILPGWTVERAPCLNNSETRSDLSSAIYCSRIVSNCSNFLRSIYRLEGVARTVASVALTKNGQRSRNFSSCVGRPVWVADVYQRTIMVSEKTTSPKEEIRSMG